MDSFWPGPDEGGGKGVLAEHGADRSGQLASDVGHEQVDAVADDVAAADHDVRDVRRGGGEHGRFQGYAVAAPAGRTLSRDTVTRLARGAGGDLPRVGPAQAGLPGRGRGLQQGFGGEVPAAPRASRSAYSTPRASSSVSTTAWLSLPRVSGQPAATSA